MGWILMIVFIVFVVLALGCGLGDDRGPPPGNFR
jgi:hypothetical protein